MLRYQKLLFIFSVVFALLASTIAYQVITNQQSTNKTEVMLVPVANQLIPSMTKITNSHIKYIEVPKEGVENLSFLKNATSIINHISAIEINENSLFIETSLLFENDLNPFNLPDGYRAFSIENTPLIAVGGHVKKGMYVDIFWNTQLNQEQKTILALQNIKVLSVGGPEDALVNEKNNQTITLMVTLEQAQRLSFMETKGNIKLALRPSPVDPITNPTPIDSTNVYSE